MKVIIYILLILSVSGCVGIGTVKSNNNPTNFIQLSPEKGIFKGGKKKNYSKKEVIQLWGIPSDKSQKGNKEYWIYNRELAWNGVIVMAIIIPIPLLIPVGMRETTLIFDNNITCGALYEKSYTETTLCGPLVPMIHGANSTCSTIRHFFNYTPVSESPLFPQLHSCE